MVSYGLCWVTVSTCDVTNSAREETPINYGTEEFVLISGI